MPQVVGKISELFLSAVYEQRGLQVPKISDSQVLGCPYGKHSRDFT